MNYFQAIFKRKCEQFFLFPFVILGRLLIRFPDYCENRSYFVFMPSADLGGANKVTLDAIEDIPRNQVLLIFTKKPKNNGMLHKITQLGYSHLDISSRIDNKLLYFLNIVYRGGVANMINMALNPVTIGGECIYYFKVVPYLKSTSINIEISHLDTWMNFSQAYWSFITYRVCSTLKLKKRYEEQIELNGIPKINFKKLIYIESWINIPPQNDFRSGLPLKILFVGRGAPQKRVNLLVKIVELAFEQLLPVYFTLVGDVSNYFVDCSAKNFQLVGNVSNADELMQYYKDSDVLILTSKYEGLPIVVMEMMAFGKIVLSTSVGSIPDYIKSHENGLLVRDSGDESEIVLDVIDKLIWLLNFEDERYRMGYQARQFAIENFSKEKFSEKYNAILLKKCNLNGRKGKDMVL